MQIPDKVVQNIQKNKVNIILAVLPLIISAFIFWSYFWPAWQQYKKNKTLLTQKENLIKKYQEKVKKKPQNLPKTKDPRLYLFRGRDPYTIVSEIQKNLSKIPGLSIRSFNIINKKPLKDGIQKVEIRFNMEGDIKSLTEMLLLFESYKKALRINTLQILYQKRGNAEKLRIILHLEALFLKT